MDSGAGAGTVQACGGDTDEVEQERTIRRIVDKGVLCVYSCSLLSILNLSRSTPSNVNLHTRSKSITLRRVPLAGSRKPIEQLGLKLHLYVREYKVPNLEVVVRRGVARGRYDDWPNRRGESGCRRTTGGEETKCRGERGWASRGSGVSRWGIEVDTTGTVTTTGTRGSRRVFDAF